MFGFLKDVGKDMLEDAMSGDKNQGNQGGGQAPPGQYGNYGPPQGGYGPPQGGYAPPPGQYGGYGPPQGGYAPPPDQYAGGYGPPQGQYGGGYVPPQGQGGGDGGGLSGFLNNMLGGDGGQQQHQQHGGGGGGGGSGMMGDLISGMASQYIGGGQRDHQSHGGSGQGDLISNIASSVIGNISSGDQGNNTMGRTGLDSSLISGIVSNVISNVSGKGSQGGAGGITGGMIAAVIPTVIQEIMKQDKDNKILPTNNGPANSAIISNIASGVVNQIVSEDPTHEKSQALQKGTFDLNWLSSIVSKFIGSMLSKGGGSGGGGSMSQNLISGVASQYIGNMLSGGGGGGQASGGHGSSRGLQDVLSGIAASILSGSASGSGGYKQSGGAIASNIIGSIMGGSKATTREDGSIQENLTRMAVDSSKRKILPGGMGGSLISSLFDRGARHLKGRFMRGKKAATCESAQGVYNYGERGSGLRSRGPVQDFESLQRECLENGTLFEDPDFPAEDSSIFFSRSPPKPFEWKRPGEISSDPQLFIDGASRFDVKQGELGDCWLLAAIANLTLSKRLFYQIVPSDQSFGDNYAGIFHFRFWQFGRWVDVVIDDRLPTFYGRLVFMHSEEQNEFWSALVEKAYAKLHGSYEALKGGTTCEAMEDFTGGVSELYDLTKAPPNLFNIMLKAYERGSLMGCSLDPDPNEVEARCDNGLVRGHAYSITRVKHCQIQTPRVSGNIPLIRIRNPWGNEAEWNGPWSDQSQEWQFIPEDEREEMGLNFEHDGEFWMSYKDFIQNFTMMEMTNLSPDSISEEELDASVQHKWEMNIFEGSWVRGATAGGCRNSLETFWHNPQYRITLTEVDDDDDDNKCTVIVALMQKNRRAQRKLGLECLTIGFAIYHLKDPDSVPRPLDLNYFKYNASAARSPSFINMREVSCRFKLPPGTYCIVPSTFDPNEEGEFLLRIFSEKANEMEENDEEVGYGDVDERVQEEEQEDTEVDDRVRNFFGNVAGDDQEISWKELQGLLDFSLKKEFDFEGFSKDVCRSMIAMLDVDQSGKLGLFEFIKLWKNIRVWKNVFRLYDKDTSGHLNGFELRQALNSAGYRLNNHILSALMLRFGDEEGNLAFDDFIMCAVKLRTLMDVFHDYDTEENGSATFSKEEFIEKTMYI